MPSEGGFHDTVSATREAREWIEVSAAAATPLFLVKRACAAGGDGEAFPLWLVSGESRRWRDAVRVSSVQCAAQVVCRNLKRDASHFLQVDRETVSGQYSQDKPFQLADGALGKLRR